MPRKSPPLAAPRKEFDFTLILTGVHELSRSVEDALYEAGCADATLCLRYGRIYADFGRESSSLQQAVLSAIQDVRRANIGADVLRVDTNDLVSQAEIAQRIGRSRQMVSLWIAGKRGGGRFPPPTHIGAEHARLTHLWSWSEVITWLCENEVVPVEAVEDAHVLSTINTALERAQQRKRMPKLVEEISHVILC